MACQKKNPLNPSLLWILPLPFHCNGNLAFPWGGCFLYSVSAGFLFCLFSSSVLTHLELEVVDMSFKPFFFTYQLQAHYSAQSNGRFGSYLTWQSCLPRLKTSLHLVSSTPHSADFFPVSLSCFFSVFLPVPPQLSNKVNTGVSHGSVLRSLHSSILFSH